MHFNLTGAAIPQVCPCASMRRGGGEGEGGEGKGREGRGGEGRRGEVEAELDIVSLDRKWLPHNDGNVHVILL